MSEHAKVVVAFRLTYEEYSRQKETTEDTDFTNQIRCDKM